MSWEALWAAIPGALVVGVVSYAFGRRAARRDASWSARRELYETLLPSLQKQLTHLLDRPDLGELRRTALLAGHKERALVDQLDHHLQQRHEAALGISTVDEYGNRTLLRRPATDEEGNWVPDEPEEVARLTGACLADCEALNQRLEQVLTTRRWWRWR